MNQIVIALGSNIDKERNLPLAVRKLQELCRVTAVASVYETVPVGLRDQPHFWNTAVLIETPLTPTQIKQTIIQPIEIDLGRVRRADPNAPRTIDADIVLFNDKVGSYDGGDGRERPLPDPDLAKFPHVAVPVADLLPRMKHPVTGERFSHLAARLLQEVTENVGERPLWRRADVDLSA